MKSRASRTKRNSARRGGARLGQHFLVNPRVAEAAANAADIHNDDTVIEVGPGKGILTAALLAQGASVIAIEKDPAMVAILTERFQKEIASKKLTLHEADVRDFFRKLEAQSLKLKALSYKVVANIPYYITGELIRLFLTAKKQPNTLVFLVQKEVAERIVGNPDARSGSRLKHREKESILSLSVKAYGTPRYVKTVKAGNFSPSPSVDSAILSITDISRKNFARAAEEETFFKVVKAGFGQKRKMLAGNLKRAFGERALIALDEVGIAKDARAEDVPLSAWLLLSQNLSSKL